MIEGAEDTCARLLIVKQPSLLLDAAHARQTGLSGDHIAITGYENV